MRLGTIAGGTALLAAGLAAAQPAPTDAPAPAPPAAAVPAPAPPSASTPGVAPPQQGSPAPPDAEAAHDGVGDRRAVPGVVAPPRREAPRAHVSIVSPSESTVHKRRRGVRPQDGDGLEDGAAQDAPSGPTVERLE